MELKGTEVEGDSDSDYDSDCADSDVSSVCPDIDVDDDLPFICEECDRFSKHSCGSAGTCKQGSTRNLQ